MPKSRLRKRAVENPGVLGARDVVKLQKLMKESLDESNGRETQKNSDNDDSSEKSDMEEFAIECIPSTTEECEKLDEDWRKFFCSTNEKHDLLKEIQKNLEESKQKVTEEMSQFSGSVLGDFTGFEDTELPKELSDHLKLILDVLRHYRSGPLPKTVKMIPHLPGWEGLLELLSPLEWTAHVYPRVVKVFASKGHEPALHFYELYLLPKVKKDIQENGCLCVQLFEALIASMFRAEEFVSGIFLPWVQSEMTKTEGVILSRLIRKATLKSRYAAVALALTMEEDFSIPRSMVIETLLSKKYHLPEAALTKVIEYFLSFDKNCDAYFTTEQRMPVTWFRSLLTFLEFYRNIINPKDRELLVKLCRRHEHPQISTEIRSLLALIPTG